MSRITLEPTRLDGLFMIVRHPIGDSRGYLERVFCRTELGDRIKNKNIRQINHTLTRKEGTLRGMHFQHPPCSEIKIVSCLRGSVLDVVVDLRKGSPTFLQHHAEVLSENNHTSLLIPEGCAHGFQTLTSDCEMLYFHTADYAPEAEGGIHARDPRLAISWPLPISEMSERDRNLALLSPEYSGIELP